MAGHPLNGVTFGVTGTITPLFDAWLDEGQLPRRLPGLGLSVVFGGDAFLKRGVLTESQCFITGPSPHQCTTSDALRLAE